MSNLSSLEKHTVDALSLATVVGTMAAWLPAIAAIFSIIWTGIRIYETKTVQGWVKGSKEESV